KGKGLDLAEFALVVLYAINAQAIRRANVQAGDKLLVVGAGPNGSGLIGVSRIAGADVIVMDVNEDRLQFCREKLNVAQTIHVGVDEPLEKLQEITNGEMPTAIFDATGNLRAIEQSLQYLAHGGTFVLVGIQKSNFSFS